MVSELCLRNHCKDCPEQRRCFGCEHNYILVKVETMTKVYKCSKCGDRKREMKNK